MTNGELFFKTFPCLEQDEQWPNILWWTDEKGKRQLLGDVYDSDFWNAEYKEPTTKNDLEIVMDAMEYRTNALIENIKSEIMHFTNAHCSGDDINIYDVLKVIDDCCEVENSTTNNDLGVDKTDMIDKSNFSQEQYKADLQSAYDCGYEQAKNDLGVDAVSRQAVLEIIEREEFKGDALSEIEKLSSVIPQLSSGLEKNSQKLEKDFGELDCISRKAVYDKNNLG